VEVIVREILGTLLSDMECAFFQNNSRRRISLWVPKTSITITGNRELKCPQRYRSSAYITNCFDTKLQ